MGLFYLAAFTFSPLLLIPCRRYMSQLLRGSYEVIYQQLPGSYSSAARFVRLRELLTQVGALGCRFGLC